jgi:dihydroorotase
MTIDLLVKGGRLIDPATGRDGCFDIAIQGDRIAEVDMGIPSDAAAAVIDASNRIVTPGLVDLHTHTFDGIGYWGVNADTVAANSGVTTWLDAGSAGALTLAGFRKYIAEPARARIFALLNVSYLGMIGPDYELARSEFCDLDILERIVENNRDLVLGLKVRMGSPTVGACGLEPMQKAVVAAERCGLPLMVHIADGPPEVEAVLELMREGDILTHCFTGATMKLVDENGEPKPAALRARERGVIMDVGHGVGSFSFAMAEALLSAGFGPDVISSDIHQLSASDQTFDLPMCLTKFLALGFSLPDVVRASTSRPAQIMGLDRELGSVAPGHLADLAIFELEQGDFQVDDIAGERRDGREALRHVATIIGGRPVERRSPAPRAPWAEPGRIWPSRQAELLSKREDMRLRQGSSVRA